ncbi:MAG: hypothetical protein U0354_19305 [Candidatus Sericytochromatia bacterium]
MCVGGIRGPMPTPQTQQAAPTQQKQETQQTQQAKASKETFNNTKVQVKLPTTNVNAMTQLKSQDQMMLMRMSQEKTIGKLSENLKGAKMTLKTDVLPKAIIGAGQSIPPAAMRAMVATRGSLFAGRAFEVSLGKESSTLSFRIGGKSFNVSVASKLKKNAKRNEQENEEDELEEDL